MPQPARLLALAAGTLAIALPGCGGGGGSGTSKSDYKQQVQQIDKQFRGQLSRAEGSLSSATTNAERSAGLERVRVAFNDVANKIDKLAPPSGAQSAQNRLVAALHRGADHIGVVEKAIKNRDVATIRSSAAKIRRDSTDVAAALQGLRDAVGR
jgi:hypothetical protein